MVPENLRKVSMSRDITNCLVSQSSLNQRAKCSWGGAALGPSQLNCGPDRQRTPLQVGDHSGNDPLSWFLVFCVGVPEWFPRMSVTVGSREIRLI